MNEDDDDDSDDDHLDKPDVDDIWRWWRNSNKSVIILMTKMTMKLISFKKYKRALLIGFAHRIKIFFHHLQRINTKDT
jgi:hypothetical protein